MNRFIVSLAICGVIVVPDLVLAQGLQTSNIVGVVLDASDAVIPGAKVTLGGPGLIGGPRETETDAAGRYRFAVLLPGVYEVTAAYPGFAPSTRSSIALPVATTLTIDLVLQAAQVLEQLVVREASPATDVKGTAVSTHINRLFLENLPTSRSVADMINLAPGVFSNVGFGGTELSNAIYVDGVDITEARLQDPWVRINHNWLEQVEVAGLGASAEYGESTGAIANSVIRSGGNRFDGLVDYLTTRPSWVGRNTDSLAAALQRQFSPLRVVSWWDAGVQAGGPITRDRLWFFTGAQLRRHEHRPAGYEGPGATVLNDKSGIVKLTAAPGGTVRLEGFVQGGYYDTDGELLGPFYPLEAAWETRQPQTMWNAKLTWTLGPRTLLEVRNGGYHSDQTINPERRDIPSRTDWLSFVTTENYDIFIDNYRYQHTTVATLSHYAPAFLGRHDLRIGLEHEPARSRSYSGFSGGMQFQDEGGVPMEVIFWPAGAGTTTSRRTAMYARDMWEIGTRVTLTPGIRIDVNRASVPLVDDAFATNPVSPRLGVAWDVLGSHRLVARVHAGRYHDPAFHMRIGSLDSSESPPIIFATVVGPGQFVEYARVGTADDPPYAIDPGLKQSRVDEGLLGIEWQARRGLSLQAHYVRRNFEHFMGIVDVGSRWIPTERRDPGPDGRLGTLDDGPFLTVYNRDPATRISRLYANPPDLRRRYDAVQFVGRLRQAWSSQVQGSYTWSRTKGNVSNNHHSNAAGNFDLALNGVGANPNRRINADGNAPFAPTHEVKMLATTTVPRWGGVSVSGVYRYVSGGTWTRRARIQLAQGGEQILMEPRGTRRLSATNTLDLRIEKSLSVPGKTIRVGLYGDIFNVTNQGVATAVNINSGAAFGQPSTWVDPRVLRMGLRLMF